jgi:hypothetical protein
MGASYANVGQPLCFFFVPRMDVFNRLHMHDRRASQVCWVLSFEKCRIHEAALGHGELPKCCNRRWHQQEPA